MKRLVTAVLATATAALCPVHAQTVEEFSAIAPGGHVMAGEVVLPDGVSGPLPGVLLISGSGRQSRDFAAFDSRYRPHHDWTQAFNAAGIAVIRFDERNTGGSGGDHRTASLQDLVDDARTVLRAASSNPGIDRARLFVLGHSEGAAIAMMLNGQGETLAGLLLAGAPARSGRRILRDQARIEAPVTAQMSESEREAAIEAHYREQVAYDETRPSLRDFLDLDVPAIAGAVTAPVFVIEGGEDWQITPPQGSELAALLRAGGNDAVVHRLYDGVNHLLVHAPGEPDYARLSDFRLDPRLVEDAVAWTAQRADLD
ncbi:alpha/beta fold hydrolase [Marinicauda algicola]|uniref:Alpha/beta fold hydrolase n=1 Tax=Marinicauda algicola TaxID=2029849 RepID=A0A4S2GYK5_9PROT|nr:alpha/beta fold hydrolase [Marinicauda algicola]TGY88310.1 alpha/beta fold hydrolase [Marinicauda algicola]